jgi:hypothetical protein
MDLINFITVDPSTQSPLSYTFSNLDLVGKSIDVRFNTNNRWVFVSEVTFEIAHAVTAPSTFLLLTFFTLVLGFRQSRTSRTLV